MQLKTNAVLWSAGIQMQKDVLFRLITVVGIAMVATLVVFAREGNSAPEQSVLKACMLLVIMEVSLASGVWWKNIDPNGDFTLRYLFIRPLPTWVLVTTTMLCAMIAAAVCQFVGSAWLAVAVDSEFPVVAPSILAAVFSSWLLAGAWACGTLPGRILGIGSAVVLIGFCFAMFYQVSDSNQPFLMTVGGAEFFSANWWLWGSLILSMPLSLGMSIHGVGKQRCGEMLAGEVWVTRVYDHLLGMFQGLGHASPVAGQPMPFRSKFDAQLWFELKYSVVRVATVVAIIQFSACLASAIFAILGPATKWDATVWMTVLALSPFVLGLIAGDGAAGVATKELAPTYSQFNATRPVTNSGSILLKIFTVAGVSMMGWLAILVVGCVHFQLFGWDRLPGVIAENQKLLTGGQIACGLCCLPAIWITNSALVLQVAYWMARYPKACWYFAGAVYAHAIGAFILLSRSATPFLPGQIYLGGVVWCATLACIGLAVCALLHRATSWAYKLIALLVLTVDLTVIGWLFGQIESLSLPDGRYGLQYLAAAATAAAVTSLPLVLGRLRHL